MDNNHYYWNSGYAVFGWFLWLGIFILFFSTMLNWSRVWRGRFRFDDQNAPPKTALDILNERYARGEITHEEFLKTRNNLLSEPPQEERKKSA